MSPSKWQEIMYDATSMLNFAMGCTYENVDVKCKSLRKHVREDTVIKGDENRVNAAYNRGLSEKKGD